MVNDVLCKSSLLAEDEVPLLSVDCSSTVVSEITEDISVNDSIISLNKQIKKTNKQQKYSSSTIHHPSSIIHHPPHSSDTGSVLVVGLRAISFLSTMSGECCITLVYGRPLCQKRWMIEGWFEWMMDDG